MDRKSDNHRILDKKLTVIFILYEKFDRFTDR